MSKLTVNGFTEEEEEEILRRAKEPGIVIDDIQAFFDSLRSKEADSADTQN